MMMMMMVYSQKRFGEYASLDRQRYFESVMDDPVYRKSKILYDPDNDRLIQPSMPVPRPVVPFEHATLVNWTLR